MYMKALSVSDINNYIKKMMDNDFILNNSLIKGEISNFKIHSSGHIYFSLKDLNSKINCVMFKSYAANLKIIPQDGMKVIVKGRISTYVKGGNYQLYCESIQLDGLGELYIAFEQLKEKLQREGLFDMEHKRPIPKYAKRIGVITSPTGAAIRDIINVTKRRNSSVNLLIYPAIVQGVNASRDVINGIEVLNKRNDIDLIIIARGGGSIEELWAFNDENLARAIYKSSIPVITGVGHEVDYTIVDFVSDKRAPTPSAAAEIAVFNLDEVNSNIINYKKTLKYNILNSIKDKYNKLNILSKTLSLNNPERNIVNEYDKIDRLLEKINYIISMQIDKRKNKLDQITAIMTTNNPLNVLKKGYSIIEDYEGNIISSLEALNEAQEVNVILKNGKGKYKIEKL